VYKCRRQSLTRRTKTAKIKKADITWAHWHHGNVLHGKVIYQPFLLFWWKSFIHQKW